MSSNTEDKTMGAVRGKDIDSTIRTIAKMLDKSISFEVIAEGANELLQIMKRNDVDYKTIDFDNFYTFLLGQVEEHNTRFDAATPELEDICKWIALDVYNGLVGYTKLSGKKELRVNIKGYISRLMAAPPPPYVPILDTSNPNVSFVSIATPTAATGHIAQANVTKIPTMATKSEEFDSMGLNVPKFDGMGKNETMSGLFPHSDNVVYDTLEHTNGMKLAELMLKGLTVDKFDGISSAYINWRYCMYEILSNYHAWNAWSGRYVILNALCGFALDHCRNVKLESSPSTTIINMLKHLDERYLTQTILQEFEMKFETLKQNMGESCDSYAARFQKMCLIHERLFGSISDLQLKVKFSKGLAPQHEWIKAFANGMNMPFHQHLETILSYTRGFNANQGTKPGLPGFGHHQQPSLGAMNGQRATGCFRCGGQGHMANECVEKMITTRRCSMCASTQHMSDKCSKDKMTLFCKRCQKKGHLSAVCRAPLPIKEGQFIPSSKLKSVRFDIPEEEDLELNNHMLSINCGAAQIGSVVNGIGLEELYLPPVETQLCISNRVQFVNINCLLDSGASSSFLHHRLYQWLKSKALVAEERPVAFSVTYADGVASPVTLAVRLLSRVLEQEDNVWFLVLEKCTPRIILGRPFMAKHGLLHAKSDHKKTNMMITVVNVIPQKKI